MTKAFKATKSLPSDDSSSSSSDEETSSQAEEASEYVFVDIPTLVCFDDAPGRAVHFDKSRFGGPEISKAGEYEWPSSPYVKVSDW